MMQTLVFRVSIAVGLCIPLLVYGTFRMGYLTRPQTLLFGIGSGLGLLWEGALVILIPRLTEGPLYSIGADVSVPSIIHVMSHSFWDGLLFLAGVLLVRRFVEGPHFRTFRWHEFWLLVAWGQIQSFVVEITAISTGVWTYHPTSWNPALFQLGGESVTAGPQVIWLIAIFVFYYCCLAVYGREQKITGHS
jgi:hypothetical protein